MEGADVYSSVMKEGIIKGPAEGLIAQNTNLGWILTGVVNSKGEKSSNNRTINVMHATINEDENLKRFWEIEDHIGSVKIFTPEEEQCEEHYIRTTKRDDDGSYIVRLPFRTDDPPCRFGNSRAIAEKRFKSLEKRLERDTDLKEKYTEVLHEYLRLGHMRPVKVNDNLKDEAVYLPHHAVIRNDKTTTKVRVVFNASEKNNKGFSLNDTLMVGPKLQADLRNIIQRWRMYPIALAADVVKMYRAVKMSDEDMIYQRILWRDKVTEDIADYELMTVTFGIASAPYQAIRTLHQIAYDEGATSSTRC